MINFEMLFQSQKYVTIMFEGVSINSYFYVHTLEFLIEVQHSHSFFIYLIMKMWSVMPYVFSFPSLLVCTFPMSPYFLPLKMSLFNYRMPIYLRFTKFEFCLPQSALTFDFPSIMYFSYASLLPLIKYQPLKLLKLSVLSSHISCCMTAFRPAAFLQGAILQGI